MNAIAIPVDELIGQLLDAADGIAPAPPPG
jgi:hypothetical protein